MKNNFKTVIISTYNYTGELVINPRFMGGKTQFNNKGELIITPQFGDQKFMLTQIDCEDIMGPDGTGFIHEYEIHSDDLDKDIKTLLYNMRNLLDVELHKEYIGDDTYYCDIPAFIHEIFQVCILVKDLVDWEWMKTYKKSINDLIDIYNNVNTDEPEDFPKISIKDDLDIDEFIQDPIYKSLVKLEIE